METPTSIGEKTNPSAPAGTAVCGSDVLRKHPERMVFLRVHMTSFSHAFQTEQQAEGKMQQRQRRRRLGEKQKAGASEWSFRAQFGVFVFLTGTKLSGTELEDARDEKSRSAGLAQALPGRQAHGHKC